MVLGNGSLQNHPGGIAQPVEDVVVVENAFRLHPILGENRHQSCLALGEEVPGDCGGIRAVQQNCDLAGDRFFHGEDLLRETLAKFFREGLHCPFTTRAALLISWKRSEESSSYAYRV